jgi:dimethylhistidine N-methyltransferase
VDSLTHLRIPGSKAIIATDLNLDNLTDGGNKLAAFYDFAPEIEDFGDALIRGLTSSPKSLPCKFFYDKRGSELFDLICKLPEYYVTRTELQLLNDYSEEILSFCGDNLHIIEFGSGSSHKIRSLLNSPDKVKAYTAIDISREHLIRSCLDLAKNYKSLLVSAICTDYSKTFNLPDLPAEGSRKIAYFPGSSIGNFSRQDAALFLKRAGNLLGSGSGLLIGIDLKKDQSLLNAAYNDSQGITAAFNLNLLHRARAELKVPFEVEKFTHDAIYNAEQGRIEMYLESKVDQALSWKGNLFKFKSGERIHTENSHKYSLDEIETLANSSGYKVEKRWVDKASLFSVYFLSFLAA